MQKKFTQNGFTMLELLIAMLLLSIVLFGLLTLQIQTIRQTGTAQRANEATRLAQSTLARYQVMDFDNINVTGSPATWERELRPDNSEMVGVSSNGASDGPYSVERMVETVGPGRLISVRTRWLASPRDSTRQHQVVLTAMRYP